jgi:hypothetical protein
MNAVTPAAHLAARPAARPAPRPAARPPGAARPPALRGWSSAQARLQLHGRPEERLRPAATGPAACLVAAAKVVVHPPLGLALRVVLHPVVQVWRVVVGDGVKHVVVGSRLLGVVVKVLLAAAHQILLLLAQGTPPEAQAQAICRQLLAPFRLPSRFAPFYMLPIPMAQDPHPTAPPTLRTLHVHATPTTRATPAGQEGRARGRGAGAGGRPWASCPTREWDRRRCPTSGSTCWGR